MAEFVDQVVAEIDGRLATLNSEVSQLEAARAALQGISSPSPSAPAPARSGNGSKSASKPAGKRGPGRPKGSGRKGGTRADQALKTVQDNPGIHIPAIAEALKIEPNYLYRIMPKLVESGQVRKTADNGWEPVPAS